jgi:hypothetical protein
MSEITATSPKSRQLPDIALRALCVATGLGIATIVGSGVALLPLIIAVGGLTGLRGFRTD